MTRTTRTGSMAAAGATALLLTLTTACGAAHQGDVQPDAVEKKAHTLTQQTLDALHSTIGTPKTTIYSDAWSKCTTETPGQHRFEYDYALKLVVSRSQVQPAVAAARAYFARQHYEPHYTSAPDLHAGATLPKSSWTVDLSRDTTTTVVVDADSDCVFTRHDPSTKT
ncbi:hypothetical protein OG896_22675 [Streptomyces sp. NBC_00669]|uniref:hypothetical protein n=1 Tax=Streptomyces sp. NBC_00669 TaxID=2976011 RepID=UPI002E344CEA|nr:hypothetical protein [Streptomyces sp. NBC_00669]